MTDDLGPLPAAHPRHLPTERARRELTSLVLRWRQFWNLTLAEELMLLSEELNRKLALAVKHERENEEAKP